MKITMRVEKQIVSKIRKLSSQEFEDFCISLFKESKRYQGIRTDSLSESNHAQKGVPDAYIYNSRQNNYIIFEFTHTNHKEMNRYVNKLCERTYLLDKKGRIEKLFLVTSSKLPNERKLALKRNIEDALACKCTIKDINDIIFMLNNVKTEFMAEHFNLTFGPKGLKPVIEVIVLMAERISAFPDLDCFTNDDLAFDKDVVAQIPKTLEKTTAGTLISGRWGSGKTVLGLYIGMKLKMQGFEPFYLDLCRPVADESAYADALIRDSINPFIGENVVFIFDNAHALPRVTYSASKYLLTRSCKCIVISRPVPEEIDEEDYYYPDLFQKPTTISIRMRVSERVVETIAASYIQKHKAFPDSEISNIFDVVGSNLTLLMLYLRAKVTSPCQDPKERIYEMFSSKFKLKEFPEWKVIAAVSILDCGVDLRAGIPDIDRRSHFLRSVEQPNQNLPVQILGYDYLVGLSIAEARLICEAIYYFNLSSDGNIVFASVSDYMKSSIVDYCKHYPQNPFRVLSSLRWSAYESRQELCFSEEEFFTNIMVETLEQPDFITHLRRLYSIRFSALALGEFFRIVNYAKINKNHSKRIVDNAIIEKGILNLKVHLSGRNRRLLFSWREHFAWKNINYVDSDLADYYLSHYDDEQLKIYGGYLPNLVNLMYIALFSQRIHQLVTKYVDDLISDLSYQIIKAHEVTLVFLFRNASYLGKNVVKKICTAVSPVTLAQAIQNGKSYTGSIFYIIYKHTFRTYYNQFISCFNPSEIYRKLFLTALPRVSWSYDDSAFNRFMKYDFLTLFLMSDIKGVQLFLRNVTRHGFTDGHRNKLTIKMKQKPFRDHILAKLASQSTSLKDVNFLVSNLYILDPQAAKYFLKITFENHLKWKLMTRCTLADMGTFLMSCTFMLGIEENTSEKVLIDDYVFRNMTKITAYDLLMIGGFLQICHWNHRIPIIVEDHISTFVSFFKRYELVIDEDDIDAVVVSNAFKFAVLVSGLLQYGIDLGVALSISANEKAIANLRSALGLSDSLPAPCEVDIARRKTISEVHDLLRVLYEASLGPVSESSERW